MVAKALFVTVVLHIVTRTNIGGVSQYLENLINGWEDEHVSHVIVRGIPSSNEGDYFVTHLVNAQIVDVRSLQRSVSPVRELRSLWAVIRAIRQIQPDIVHTHMAKAGVVGRLAAWICRVPIRVHTFHGHLLQGYFPQWTVWLIVRVERLLQRVTTWSITNGEQVRQDLLRQGVVHEDSSSNIPPAAQPLTFNTDVSIPRTQTFRRTVVTAGFVGRLATIKRPDRFVKCAEALPQYNFVMFGDGPLGDEIRARVQNVSNLHFAGWVTDPSLIYSSFDVLVLTSDNEAAAVVLIEAAMSGIPAIAMNVGSVSEVIVHEQTGLLVESEAELLMALRRLLGDQDLRQRLGRQAHTYAQEHFTTTRLVHSHQDLYQRLLAR